MKTTDKALVEKLKEEIAELKMQLNVKWFTPGSRLRKLEQEIASLEAQDKEPISTPEVIVGPSEEEIDKRADKYSNNWDEDSTQKSISYTSYRRGAKYALSQLKTVNLKDELEKIKQKALKIQDTWEYPNEVYIECTGAIMACNELLENLSKDSQSKNK